MLRAILLTLAMPLLAHHSTAEFDLTRSVTITGVVTKFTWANPHSYVELDVERVHWKIEMDAVNFLRRQGWSKDTLTIGDHISCTGAPGKDTGAFTLKSFIVEFANGKTLRS